MLNDENDKWSDNAELPINNTYDSESPEGSENSEIPEGSEQLEEKPRKILNNQFNYQKEMSMEELMNYSGDKEDPIKDLTKNNKSKEESIRSITNISTNSDIKNIRKESINNLSKNGKSKEESVSKTDELTKSESEPKDIVQENQEFKEKLVKLKEENQLKELKEPSYIVQQLKLTKDLIKYIKNLDSTIKQLAIDLKESTDAKSWEAISRGSIKVRRYANYYDVSSTITTAGASNPNDFDSAVYNIEKVFEDLERYAEIMYVANDGSDTLYVIVSHGGRTRFSQEAPIYPGEIKFYYNVYEIRLRSPTAGLPYRATEYRILNISEISSIPIEKANLHNVALPAANTNLFATDITPTNTPTTLMIEVAVSIAGNFRAVMTKGGNPQIVTFNVVTGPALIAGGVYIFNLLVDSGDSVNFTYSVTGGTIQLLRVQEIDSATA
jgi:hypothetical protein